jgi:hypothetical protein
MPVDVYNPGIFVKLRFSGNMENKQLQLAEQYVESTNAIVFLTGKAGTGKTTFLRGIRQTSVKKMAIVAPTGVAAINAGGMTIHSFFQLPFGPLMPDTADRPELHYSPEKKELLTALELLIIDEISMVRPDVLDQIDLILRNVRGLNHPFGGVQLLMIGDLAQLSPIVRDEEWGLLRRYYATPYFFSSLVLQRAPYVYIELDKVYRQNEPEFVTILNEVRNQSLSEAHLKRLNERYMRDFKSDSNDSYITLTTHNRIAQQINEERLQALEGTETEYAATIRGDFPRDAYPTDTTLKLKTGAQVMFVKNDNSADKLYYNGKIGTVIKLTADTVYVECADGREIPVQALEWTNMKYELSGDDINETNTGSFAQIPLKLAWAITIHKSQGLTFDKAIIDVSEAFTHGQAYVALSRCRSLGGMVLRNPIAASNIMGDPAVIRFNESAQAHQPDQNTLQQHQDDYRVYLLTELFAFGELKQKLGKFEPLLPNLEKDIFDVADKMERQLKSYPADRVKKASVYFHEKLEQAIKTLYEKLPVVVGSNKELAGKADGLMRVMMSRLELLSVFSQHDFSTEAYLELRRNLKIELTHSYLKALNAKPNEKLYEQLLDWREIAAKAENVMPNMILTEKTAALIAEKLPATLKALSGIKGVGPEKSSRYGAAILTVVRAYQQEVSGAADQGSLF